MVWGVWTPNFTIWGVPDPDFWDLGGSDPDLGGSAPKPGVGGMMWKHHFSGYVISYLGIDWL